MQLQTISANVFESKKKTVNKAIKICVECGSLAVCIDGRGVFCKDCGSFFDMEKENE